MTYACMCVWMYVCWVGSGAHAKSVHVCMYVCMYVCSIQGRKWHEMTYICLSMCVYLYVRVLEFGSGDICKTRAAWNERERDEIKDF
jgi:hypothetical protein